MSEDIKNFQVSVPHRISGFFEIVDKDEFGREIKNPEKIGSRGAGFNLSAMGRTRIKIRKNNDLETLNYEIYINNNRVNEKAETSLYILNYVKKVVKKPIDMEIHHNFELPVGCGYGASGSGALGLIIGLNKALNLDLNSLECGRIAHIAEVINKTGLGTVCGQLIGGLSILKNPGYPCKSEKIKLRDKVKIFCTSFGEISTKSILSDPALKQKIKIAGSEALSKLLFSPSIKTFMKVSIEFVKKTKLLKLFNLEEIEEFIETLNKLDIIGASMNQLGKSVYAICKKNKIKEVEEVFESYNSPDKIYKLRIKETGPKVEFNE